MSASATTFAPPDPGPVPSPAAGRWMRFRRRLAIAATVGTIGLGTLLSVLPLIAGTTGPVLHSYIDALPEEYPGTYLVTDDGVMQLYTWEVLLEEFPDDAPDIRADRLQEVAIVARTIAPPNRYVLYSVAHRAPVPWQRVEAEGDQVILDPGRLEPGQYVLLRPEDSSFGGDVRNYFEITEEDT